MHEMNSRDSSKKRSGAAADFIIADVTPEFVSEAEQPVSSIEEFVEFLEQLEAVFGPDDQPRPATEGIRFLL